MAARESPKLSAGVRFSRGVPGSLWKRAGVRSNGAASKADGPQGHRGSNPLASARQMGSRQDRNAPDSESGHAQVRFLPPPLVFLALAQMEEHRSTKPEVAGSIPAGEASRQQRVAQQVARKLGELEVASSNLATLTRLWSHSSIGRALAWHAGGWRFDPARFRQQSGCGPARSTAPRSGRGSRRFESCHPDHLEEGWARGLCRQPAKLLPPRRRRAGSNPAPSASPASLAQWQSGCLTSSGSAVQSRRDAPPHGTVA